MRLLSFFLLSFLLANLSLAQDSVCQHYFSETQNTYDLTPAYTGSDVPSPPDNTGYQYYYISPCHNTSRCASTASPSPVCQIDGAGTPHGCGMLSSGIWAEIGDGGGFTLWYSDGEKGRASIITYTCDMSTTGKWTQSPVDDQTKTYRLYYSTMYACPLNSTSSTTSTSSSTGTSTSSTGTSISSSTGSSTHSDDDDDDQHDDHDDDDDDQHDDHDDDDDDQHDDHDDDDDQHDDHDDDDDDQHDDDHNEEEEEDDENASWSLVEIELALIILMLASLLIVLIVGVTAFCQTIREPYVGLKQTA